jgi:dTDP-4-amino-4,6-dideoxygalactose transaminase
VGLAAILNALGIGRGDEVATQAFTCLAVPEAIMAVGAKPLYIDIEKDGVNMSAGDLATRITGSTRAVIVQHTYGIPADMDRLMNLARENGIPVIEDCCHTVASRYRGRDLGSFGVASFYSFEWGKPIVVGIGGSVLANTPKLAAALGKDYRRYREPRIHRQIRLLAQFAAHAIVYRPTLYWPVRDLFHAAGKLGLGENNYNPIAPDAGPHPDFSTRMSGVHRFMLRRKLRGLGATVFHARRVSRRYERYIPSGAAVLPITPQHGDAVYARYPLFVDDKPRMLARARERRIELSGWYSTPVHPLEGDNLLKVHYPPGCCPNAERANARIVSLPTHLKVRPRHIDSYVSLFN